MLLQPTSTFHCACNGVVRRYPPTVQKDTQFCRNFAISPPAHHIIALIYYKSLAALQDYTEKVPRALEIENKIISLVSLPI